MGARATTQEAMRVPYDGRTATRLQIAHGVRMAELRRARRLTFVFLVFLGCVRAADGQTTNKKPEPDEDARPPGVSFVWKKPPSLQLGDLARLDFRIKIQNDVRAFSPQLRQEDPNDLRRARAGIEGTVLKVVEYEVDYDFAENDHPLRDAFVDVRVRRPLQVRAGKFKMPFSREALTGAMNLDFAFRSRAADRLAPGRDIGAMAHGRFFGRRLSYQVGIFRQDGENAESDDLARQRERGDSFEGARTLAARATVDTGWIHPTLKDLTVGLAMTRGTLPEGRNSVRGRMALAGGFFPAVDVAGNRQRVGLEFTWARQGYSAYGEFIRVRDDRCGQGLEDQDLPALIARGWYLAGAWRIGAGKGPLEVTTRYEGLRFASGASSEDLSRSPRAANLVPNTDRAWTAGLNWYLNPFIKLQGNAIREHVDDLARAPIPDRNTYWSSVLRLQFVL
jgi:phosphate-selective porin